MLRIRSRAQGRSLGSSLLVLASLVVMSIAARTAGATAQIFSHPHAPQHEFRGAPRGLESPPEKPPAAWRAGEQPWPARMDDEVEVLLYSGEFVARSVDLRVPGRGLDFVWARKYRSQVGPDSALGHGWDFSYDMWVEGGGLSVTVRDGNTRADRYLLQSNGKYAAVQLFREGEFNPDGTFTLALADGLRWNFRSLTASPAPGRVATCESGGMN